MVADLETLVGGEASAMKKRQSCSHVICALAAGMVLGTLAGVLNNSSSSVMAPKVSPGGGTELFARHAIASSAHAAGIGSKAVYQGIVHTRTGYQLQRGSKNPWERLAIAAIQANNRRGTSIRATGDEGVAEELSKTDAETKEEISEMSEAVALKASEMAGVTAPFGFWDPLGFSTDCPEGKLLFYREVELKHGRVGMLASLGILVAEQFHPLFGGDIEVPAYIQFQSTPLQTFWPAVLFAVGYLEVFSVFTFNAPKDNQLPGKGPWTIRSDHESGNLGFDPLSLKPTDPKEFKELQTKEINNGRLAMIAAAGMLAQELATGNKIL